jgi:hypothetical protein
MFISCQTTWGHHSVIFALPPLGRAHAAVARRRRRLLTKLTFPSTPTYWPSKKRKHHCNCPYLMINAQREWSQKGHARSLLAPFARALGARDQLPQKKGQARGRVLISQQYGYARPLVTCHRAPLLWEAGKYMQPKHKGRETNFAPAGAQLQQLG